MNPISCPHHVPIMDYANKRHHILTRIQLEVPYKELQQYQRYPWCCLNSMWVEYRYHDKTIHKAFITIVTVIRHVFLHPHQTLFKHVHKQSILMTLADSFSDLQHFPFKKDSRVYLDSCYSYVPKQVHVISYGNIHGARFNLKIKFRPHRKHCVYIATIRRLILEKGSQFIRRLT